MLVYFKKMYNYIYSFCCDTTKEPKFEKPRGYKNIATHEIKIK